MKQLSCLRNMASGKQWMPEQEAEPGTEIKSGDLYLVSSQDSSSNTSPSSPSSPSSPGRRRVSRYPVQVKVYRSCLGHYAVLTASLRAPATYLNLRTCNCRPCGGPFSSSFSSSPTSPLTASNVSTFRVELGGGEGQVIYFEVGSREKGEVEEWVNAFQGVAVPSPGSISPSLSPVIPRSPIMPTLQESLEEEEEEEIGGLG